MDRGRVARAVIARSTCDEAIHSFFMRRNGLLRFARNDVVKGVARQIDPSAAPGVALAKPGQIISGLQNTVSSPKIKNISLFQKCETGHIYRHPVPTRGASAVVTNEGRVAVDADVGTDERGRGVR